MNQTLSTHSHHFLPVAVTVLQRRVRLHGFPLQSKTTSKASS